MEYNILHIEDSKTDADLVKRLLLKSGMNFTYKLASDKNEVIELLKTFEPNVILCDHSLPSFNSKMAYELCKEVKPNVPFLLVTGTVSEEYAVEMLKSGVDDYLLKSNLQRLPIAIEHAVSKREVEETVSRNEKRFSALIENSADMKTLASFDGKLLYASPSVSKVLGYTLDEFLNTPPTHIIHPDDIAGVFENVQKIIQTEGSSFTTQHRLKHKNGNYLWCEGTMTNLLNEPHLNAIVSNFRDVSEKKKLELLLNEASTIARIGAWNVDLISGTIFWSDMTKEIHEADYNYIPDLATGLNFYKEGKMRDVITLRVKEAIEDGRSWDEELKIITVKNNERWIRTIGNTEFINGKCLRIYGSFQDIDQRKKAEENLIKSNRLYAFITAINQGIVHTKDESTLFCKSCLIAHTIGKFKMAWIGKFDHDNKKILLVDQNGIPEKNIHLFSASYENNGPQDHILRSGSYYVCNNIEKDLELESWKPFAALNAIKSCIILPIKKEGSIVGSLNLYSTEINFFDEAEIALLQEATDDISFALDVFEKEKRNKLAEELIFKNENRFRLLIEKSTSMKTVTDKEGKFIYCSPSINKIFGYSQEAFLNESAFRFFHPEDLPDLLKNRAAIAEVPGKSFSFQYRLRHINGTWIWCEGTLSNMLDEPGIQGFVTNFNDISARKLAEAKLETSEKQFRAMIENSADMITLAQPDGTMTYASPSIPKILGYELEEFFQLSGLDLIHPEDVDAMFQKVQDVLQTPGKSFYNQHRLKHKSGDWLWTEGTMTNMLQEPSIGALISNFRDISERKKAEDEVIESEKEVRAIAESMPQIVWVTTADGKNIYFNHQWVDYTGLTLEESLGDCWLLPFHEQDKPLAWEAWNNAVKTLSEYSVECRLQKHDGSYRWWLVRGVPKINENGKIVKWYGTYTDIEKIKEKEKEIIKSELFNRSLINSITAHIAVVDDTGTITDVNNAWVEFGLNNGETTMERIGKGANYFQACEKAAAAGDSIAGEVLQGMKDILNEKQKVFYMEYPCFSPTEKRWFSIWVVKFEGKERLIITLHTDITDRKKEADERGKITSDLIQRNLNLEQFSYIVSHNLRAPVANILGFAELMKYENSNPSLIHDVVKGMSVAAKNMDVVIKDLNEILKISTVVSENKTEVHFQDLVEDISLSIDNIIKKENVIIHTDFKSVGTMLSIKSYLYSIFYNLILNSIKFHKAGVRPLIEMKSIRTSNGLQLIFKDNGMGIDLDKHKHNLFGLYKRFHLEVEGKGMGMFMVKTQVETLGGKISVSSGVNKGTEFTIEFENIYL